MLKSQKFELTCSYCSKLFKDPIELPCGDSICREHLSEPGVVKENRIKCTKCKKDFEVKENEFNTNVTLKKLVEDQSHLSGEEQKLKLELEETIRKFFEFYEEFVQNRTQLDMDAFDHYQELRFQIDEHRERLKEKIDEIALKMIDATKKHEEMYLRNIKERFSSFDHSQSLQIKLNEIDETFRDPKLLIQSIREIQRKQEETLNDIQLKLNEMNRVKVNLKRTNEFRPNLSSFNQEEEASLFGSIRLNQYSNQNPFDSEILKDERQCLELIKLCEFSPSDKWSLLYHATRDGFGSKDFHSKCDGHSNTLTLLKAKESKFIFGGYTTISWVSSIYTKWRSDPNAFIFSLTNKDNQPVKMKIIDPNEHDHAICCVYKCGPSFGCGIHIANNANTTMDCYSNLGYTYRHPQYAARSKEAENFLAGSFNFQLDEIEVYERE